jgi:hypothetical protein
MSTQITVPLAILLPVHCFHQTPFSPFHELLHPLAVHPVFLQILGPLYI